MRKSILKFTAIFCVLAILAVSCPVMAAGTPAEPATATSYVLPVFETSDVHGFLVNTASGSEASYAYRMAYIAGIVDSARTASGAASTLLLDGGDIYQGNAISNLLNGEPLTHAYCAMRYDAVALGNHEFDWGVTTLCDSDGTMSGYKASDGSWVDSTVPVLCGNLYEAGTTNRVNFTKDYIILDKTATASGGGEKQVKVAVIGYAEDYSSSIMTAKIAPYTIDDSTTALKKVKSLAASLKESGKADAVVVLSHAGASDVASSLYGSEVDLVCGGHTHSSVSGTSGSVAYIQPAAQAQAYAYAELSFNEAGSVSVTTETTRSVSDASCYSTASGLDAEVLSISKAAVAAVSGELNTVLGYITSSITNTRTSAGNFICDLMNSATGSQAAFTNSGGVRTSFTVSGESRNVTMADIYTMMPFCNMLYVFKVSYFELSQAVANKSLYMSGVDAYFSGNALTALVVNDKCIYKDGAWADGWKTADVLVSVNEYVATGYNPFKDWISEGKAIDTTSYVDNVTFIAELQKQTAQTGGLISVDNTLHTIYGAYSGSLYTGKPNCEHKYIATVTGPTCTEQGYTTYTCALCGDTYRADYTPALGHNYVQTGKTEPSGSTDGSVTYTCSRCGDTYSQRIPAAGYTVTTICTGGSITPAQNAAYGQSVTISYEPDSGKVLSKLLVDGTEIKLYTTDEYGVNHYCFLTQYTFTGLSANHTIEAVFAAPETQAEPCTLSTSCSAGGKISAGGTLAPMQTISVLLTPDDGYYISAVTINGMQADIAERYDFSYTPGKMLTIDARFASLSGHVHSYTAVVTPPTCTEGGYTTYTCVCGDSYRAEETAALGHDYVEKELSHAATCETQSRILYTCSRCGASYTELRTEPCPSAKFTDVDTTRWYHYGIDYVTSCGMMAGVGNDKFEPNGTLTRAMLVTILYRLENQPDMTGYESPFTDVPSGQYYTNAVLWAQVYGIVSGVSENKFAPNVKITREQIAAILYKYTCMKNKEEIKPTVSLQTFKDAGQISAYAVVAMQWAVEVGVLSGISTVQLAPKQYATRAQFAAMLKSYFKS